MKKLAIKKGDSVEVIAGSQKGTRGAVLEINSSKLQVKVQGVRVQTHFDKKEGVLKKEGFIDYSNVKLVEKAKAEGKKSKVSARK